MSVVRPSILTTTARVAEKFLRGRSCARPLAATIMAHLYRDVSVKSLYTDRKFNGGHRNWQSALETTTTLYIGNLSFYTEEQLYALFSRVGAVRRIVMGSTATRRRVRLLLRRVLSPRRHGGRGALH